MSRDELDREAVARIAKRVRERGPGIVRRARVPSELLGDDHESR